MNADEFYPESLRDDLQKIVEQIHYLWGHSKAFKIKDSYTYFEVAPNKFISIYKPDKKDPSDFRTKIYTVLYDLTDIDSTTFSPNFQKHKVLQIYGRWSNEDKFYTDEFCNKTLDMSIFESFFREDIQDFKCQKYIQKLAALLNSIKLD